MMPCGAYTVERPAMEDAFCRASTGAATTRARKRAARRGRARTMAKEGGGRPEDGAGIEAPPAGRGLIIRADRCYLFPGVPARPPPSRGVFVCARSRWFR